MRQPSTAGAITGPDATGLEPYRADGVDGPNKGSTGVRKWLGLVLLLGVPVGCATEPAVAPLPTRPVAARPSLFNPNHAHYILEHGSNIIEGQASVRYEDGGLASCAGDSATLVPDTAYTRARLNRLYGGRRDFAPISTAPRLSRDPQYETYVRHAPCDAEGKFRFDQVADGAYVVVAALRQPGEKRAEGVSVRQAVSVHGGETRDMVLTH
jgi:hypothetical protein